jgi:hypothetical protein
MNKLMVFVFFLLQFSIFAQPTSKQYEPAGTEEDFKKNYEERIKKERLMGRYIPKDINDAFVVINTMIEDKDREKFKNFSEQDALHKLYFSFHRWIIVNWGFEGGSRFSHYLKNMGLSHPDDMATFVVITYHRKLNNKDLGIKDLATTLKEKRKKLLETSRKRTTISEEIIKKPKN